MAMDQIERLTVPMALHRSMQSHLEAGYPNEACGIMIGAHDGETVIQTRVVEAENQNQERGHDRFEIDPLFYMRTERELGDDEAVIGFVHSHPDCPEVPSETDRQYALNWPGFVWLIYRIEQGNAASSRAWVLDDSDQFRELILGIEHT